MLKMWPDQYKLAQPTQRWPVALQGVAAMPSMNRALVGGTGALIACLAPTVCVPADEPPQLEEVVVTAEKRVENVQTVPIAVTVVGGETFTKANVSGFSDLVKFTPSVTMTAVAESSTTAIVVAGVETLDFTIAAAWNVV